MTPRIGYMENPVVHLMIGVNDARTACGKYRRESLPAGHLWVRPERAHGVSCPACQRLLPEIMGGTSCVRPQ